MALLELLFVASDKLVDRIMSVAATAKCTVCGFDFSGCGSSDGENVSYCHIAFAFL